MAEFPEQFLFSADDPADLPREQKVHKDLEQTAWEIAQKRVFRRSGGRRSAKMRHRGLLWVYLKV